MHLVQGFRFNFVSLPNRIKVRHEQSQALANHFSGERCVRWASSMLSCNVASLALFIHNFFCSTMHKHYSYHSVAFAMH